MGGILLVLLLAPLLWAIMWLVALLGYKLSKRSPWRLVGAIFYVSATFGLIALQLHLLSVIETDKFARSNSLFVIVPDIVPGVILMFYKAVKEENAKKHRGAASSNYFKDKEHFEQISSSMNNSVQCIEIMNKGGVLKAVIAPRRNKYKSLHAVLVVMIGPACTLGSQILLMHPHPRTPIGLMRFDQVFTVIAVGYILALPFTGRSALLLDAKFLKIESSLLGFTMRKKTFENPDIRNLRFAQWQIESQNKSIERSGIRFEVGSKTHTFGSTVTAMQAHELLESMGSIYSFPMPEERHV